MDSVIAKVMDFARTLVNADRASLFLVDSKAHELYASIFDMGNGMTDKISPEIRFPMGTGIAGQVARTGEVSWLLCIAKTENEKRQTGASQLERKIPGNSWKII